MKRALLALAFVACIDRPPTVAETYADRERAWCVRDSASYEEGLRCLDAVDCRYGVGPCHADGGADGPR